MKFYYRQLLSIALLLVSFNTLAADIYVNVFYEKNPLQGVGVEVNGDSLGKTDARGYLAIPALPGRQNVGLLREGKVIATVTCEIKEDEDAEIVVTFLDAKDEPSIAVSIFEINDKSVSGFVGGVVTDQQGNPIAGAIVREVSSGKQVKTDANGVYEMVLPRGSYALEITRSGYSLSRAGNVRVMADLGVSVSVKMPPKATAAIAIDAPPPIEEVVTVGVYKAQDTAAGIERFSTNVLDVMDADQIERFGDTNVAASLSRLVGVTVTEGRYANVRGLDGRYISSSLNGLLMPSTDPLRRDVQLDLFPLTYWKRLKFKSLIHPRCLVIPQVEA